MVNDEQFPFVFIRTAAFSEKRTLFAQLGPRKNLEDLKLLRKEIIQVGEPKNCIRRHLEHPRTGTLLCTSTLLMV